MAKKNSRGPRISDSEMVDLLTGLFRKKKVAAFGLTLIVFCILIAIFADVIAPYKMVNGALPGKVIERLQPPSKEHLFGTDTIGRDLFSYMIYGTRTSVIISLSCTLITMVEAVIIGVASAVIGGWFDLIVQRFVDALLCIPGMLISLVLIVSLGSGIPQMIIVLSVPNGIVMSRMFRSTAISVKDSGYMEMAKMLGAGRVWQMTKHVIPNIMHLVLMIAAGIMGNVIMMEASLSFLGFGMSPTTPDWGAMLTSSGRSSMYNAPWLAIIPGLAIALLVFAAAMLGDGIRDILDPRLKGGVANYQVKKRKHPQNEAGQAPSEPSES